MYGSECSANICDSVFILSMNSIQIKGARQNNLKNIDLDIPRNKIVVFTGVSGSGKSSLVFETITAEAQRQLYDTFSTFARSRLPKYEQADYDLIQGLSPVIVLEQKRITGNSRSTVGTITEISSFLRLLFSRIGEPLIGPSNYFSFNKPEGMCLSCGGVGRETNIDLDKVFDWSKSLNEGAIRFPDFKVDSIGWKIVALSGFFDKDKALDQYSEEEKERLLYAEGERFTFGEGEAAFDANFNGIITKINNGFLHKDIASLTDRRRKIIEQFITSRTCKVCLGSRLNQKALAVTIKGKNIHELSQFQLNDLYDFMSTIETKEALTIVEQISYRLKNLVDLGVGYLNVSRQTGTLSGGEAQRVKLSKQLGNSLTEMLYVLDEPSVGLHPRDVHLVNDLLIALRDAGNTILVVEHDPDVIKIADHIVDMGPKAGRSGGKVVYQGSYEGLKKSNSLTGNMLKKGAPDKKTYRKAQEYFYIKDANDNNLKNVSVAIPKNIFTCITGVAGSGKSSLIHQAFLREYPDSIIIDQSPIGKSVRSNPATYTGVFDDIRKLFGSVNKVDPSLFSFNAKGACSKCKGVGFLKIDMAFLDPVKTQCEQCGGKRYNEKALVHLYKGKNIANVLDLTINEALQFFDQQSILKKLSLLEKVGVGYLSLGQSISTLSGGECQRVKLASELHKEGNIYILDEPTTGLHLSDISLIIKLFDELVDHGNTLIVIEHSLDIIHVADWIIDIGPEGGIAGGEVVFEGTPSEIKEHPTSYTGRFLKRYA